MKFFGGGKDNRIEKEDDIFEAEAGDGDSFEEPSLDDADEYRFSDDYGFARERTHLGPLKKYLITVTAIVGVFVIVAGSLVFAYSKMKGISYSSTQAPDVSERPQSGDLVDDGIQTDEESAPQTGATVKPDSGFLENLLTPPRKTNVLIIGVDQEGYLADVNIVACFDYVQQEVNFINIPRDTFIKVSDADIAEIKRNNRFMPSSGQVKLTELHSYAGKTDGPKYMRKYINAILGIEIDYFVKIDLNAFRYIVDAVGGIVMDIRDKGFKYKDPEQGLVIDVPGGKGVRLDGKLAEGAVRYRDDYANGDLDRIKFQQEFMREFIKQVMNKDSIMGNITSFYNMVNEYVVTDFTADKLILYADAVTKIDMGKIGFYTLPGSPNGSPDYFHHSESETAALVDEVFKNYDIPEEVPEEVPEEEVAEETAEPAATENNASTFDLKSMKIQVLNGGSITGKAGNVRDILRADGYTITSLGNYTGTKKEQTRIMTAYEMDASKLCDYFSDAVVEVDEAIMDTAYDIIIIIGTGEN